MKQAMTTPHKLKTMVPIGGDQELQRVSPGGWDQLLKGVETEVEYIG